MRFSAQPARRLFIVRVGLLPSAQLCRKLRDTHTINNCKYGLLVIGTLEIAYFGTWKKCLFYDQWISRPLTFGAWFCRKFCDLYTSIYGTSGYRPCVEYLEKCKPVKQVQVYKWIRTSGQQFRISKLPGIHHCVDRLCFVVCCMLYMYAYLEIMTQCQKSVNRCAFTWPQSCQT